MTTPSAPVYVVDDDVSARESIAGLIRSAGWRVETFASAHEFLASQWARVPSCLVLDVQLPGLSGLDLQRELAKTTGEFSIIFLTGHGDIPMSVRAMKAGAFEFLTKPPASETLLDAVRNGVSRNGVRNAHPSDRASYRTIAERRAGASSAGRMIGQSAPWCDVLNQARQVAATEATVLLQGESGSGKEVVARFLHRASPRKDGPFVALNCAALPEQLLESELFGYERGAFTGAQAAKPGQMELASGGVLFLDEVSEMSPAAQAKFLRVLQEREFQRLGGTRLLTANVRVIAATNRDLRAAVEEGDFREDLYYRLQVFDIVIPPLRERAGDIALLAEAFLQEIGQSLGRPPARLTPDAIDALGAYEWPGNVRQLRNVLERAAILCDDAPITRPYLSLPAAPATSGQSKTDLGVLERQTIEHVMRATDWNKSKAAARLGLTRTQLYVRLRKYGLAAPV